jgi:hypothetical protein
MRRCNLASSDQNLDATVEAGIAQFRKGISGSVHRIIGQYATQINLRCASKQRQLESDVIDALLWCVVADVEGPTRKRVSHIRKDLMRVEKEAEAAEKHLERLRSLLSDLPPQYGELLNNNLESIARSAVSLVAKQVPWFHALSLVAGTARAIARALRGADKGGAPRMLAFRKLVRLLIPAFERATGRLAGVTLNPNVDPPRYEGAFVNLVESVVPVALSFKTADRQMPIPNTAYARGRYIDRMTGPKGRKKKA